MFLVLSAVTQIKSLSSKLPILKIKLSDSFDGFKNSIGGS